jgi:hypothetical protein
MAGHTGPLIEVHRTVGSPGRHASAEADFGPLGGTHQGPDPGHILAPHCGEETLAGKVALISSLPLGSGLPFKL